MYSTSLISINFLSHTSPQLTDGVDFYNILIHNGPESESSSLSLLEWALLKWTDVHGTPLERALGRLHTDPLSALMNGPIKKQLGIPEKVIWGST